MKITRKLSYTAEITRDVRINHVDNTRLSAIHFSSLTVCVMSLTQFAQKAVVVCTCIP